MTTPEVIARADPPLLAIEVALPQVRAARRAGLKVVVAIVTATAALSYFVLRWTNGEVAWIVLVITLGVFGVLGVFGWTRSKHERLITPIIADAFGLQYQKYPPLFYESLPTVFIPRGGARTAEGLMAGKVADCMFRFAECKTETGRKNSSILFKGVVLQVQG